jgi:hypothetical protein
MKGLLISVDGVRGPESGSVGRLHPASRVERLRSLTLTLGSK